MFILKLIMELGNPIRGIKIMKFKITDVVWHISDEDIAKELALTFWDFKTESALEFCKAVDYFRKFKSREVKNKYGGKIEDYLNYLFKTLPDRFDIDVNLDEDRLDNERYIYNSISDAILKEYGFDVEDFKYEMVKE